MPSQVITRQLGQAAPQSYELGNAEVLTPTAVYAHFDGSGAAAAFLPCVSYYTQDGRLFARAFPPSSVAAGASADVSFFPGLSQSPASSAGITTVQNTDGTIVVTNGTGPTVTLAAKRYTDLTDTFNAPSQSIPNAGAAVTELTWQASGGNQGWWHADATTFLLTATVAGLYAVRATATYLGTVAATKQWLFGGGAQNAYATAGPVVIAPIATPITGAFTHPNLGFTDLFWADAGDQYFIYTAQNQGAAQNVQATCDFIRIW